MTTLIVLSHLRWGFVHQRPQHLLSRLAATFDVVYVEEPLHDDTSAAHLEVREVQPHVRVLVPHTPVAATGFHDEQLPVVRALLESWCAQQRLGDDLVLWLYTPMALPFASGLAPRMVVYDCMDELAAFMGAPRQLRQRESALLKRADVVLTGGPSLYEIKRALHPRVHCLPSSVDAAHFAPRARTALAGDAEFDAAQALQASMPRPRLGFFGVVDERMDLALVDALARSRPAWQVVMVGPVVKIDPAALPRRPNLHWLGMQPYERLPHLMADWDVCLMPFALNEATRYISPTKTLEYMAGEKPVVATPVADVVSLYGDLVRIARGADAFVAACDAALAETPAERARRLVRSVAAVHRSSWRQHAVFVRRLIEAHLEAQAVRPAPIVPTSVTPAEAA